MNSNQSSHGFGLGVFALLLLTSAFVVMFYVANPIFASLLGLLSAIIGAAAYIEARRANGPRKFATTVLLLAVFGTLLIILMAGINKSADSDQGINRTEKELKRENEDLNKKIDELEKKLEKLEEEN